MPSAQGHSSLTQYIQHVLLPTPQQGHGEYYEANLIAHLRDGLGMHLMQKIRTGACDNCGQFTAGLGNPFTLARQHVNIERSPIVRR